MTADCSDSGHTHSSRVRYRCPGPGGITSETAVPRPCPLPSFFSTGCLDWGPPCCPHWLPRPTPLLSMQVALLRGQSQPRPVQPGSHTHWPMEQRPRSAEQGEEGRATFAPAVQAAHLLGRAGGRAGAEAISSPLSWSLLPSILLFFFSSHPAFYLPLCSQSDHLKHKSHHVVTLFKNL